MISVTLTFAANGQQLVRTGCEKFAANTVNYIQAKFNLGEGWDGFDSVRAVWQTDFAKIATVLDNDGNCTVPQEVLKRVNSIMVNLVGSISDGTELTDRLTTYKIKALDVNGATNIDGTETAEITPSQFEQFVAIVRDEVAEVKDIDRVELNPDYTLTIYFSDGTSTTTGSIRGEAGPAGPEGPAGETGNGIESVDLTGSSGNIDTYTISFTDGSTTTFTVTNGEVTMEQLSQVLPTDTASGDIASFPDGTDLIPLQSLTVTLDPVQDLHGYDAPWVGGAGKNKLPYIVGGTSGDATAAVSSDGSVTLNGTGYARFYTDYFTVPAGTYILNGNTDYPNTVIYLDGVSGSSDTNTGATITFSEETTVRGVLQIYPDKTVSNLTLKPMLRKSTESSTYSPYSNICPISGHTEVDVEHTGVNIWDEEWELGYYNVTTGEPATSSQNLRSKNFIPVVPNTSYYVKTPTGYIAICEYDADKNFIRCTQGIVNSGITTTADTHFIRFHCTSAYGTTYNNDISINYPSTDHDYHAYEGDTYTAQLPETVYGGTIDLVSGVLTVDRAMVTLDGTHDIGWENWRHFDNDTSAWLYRQDVFPIADSNDIACDKLATVEYVEIYSGNVGISRVQTSTTYSFGIRVPVVGLTTVSAINAYLAENPIEVVYPLATPQTYQLTPQQINSLLGDNNVWSEQGSVAVVYKADIQLWIEKKLA